MKKMWILIFIPFLFLTVCSCTAGERLQSDNGQITDEGNCEETGDTGGDDIDDPVADFEEEADDPAPDPAGTFDYSLLAEAGHPRLLIDDEGFAALKVKVTSDRFSNPTLYKLHRGVLSRAESIVSDNRQFTGPSDHYVVVDNLLSCAYAYRMTGQEAYLAKARSDLDRICGLSHWNPDGLSVGEVSLAVALAYDWLYYDLDLETRIQAHEAMVRNGIKPVYNKDMSTSIGNWNSIILGGAACASLAVYEKDREGCRREQDCDERHLQP